MSPPEFPKANHNRLRGNRLRAVGRQRKNRWTSTPTGELARLPNQFNLLGPLHLCPWMAVNQFECRTCRRGLEEGRNVLEVQEGIIGKLGFVALGEKLLFCNFECLRHYSPQPQCLMVEESSDSWPLPAPFASPGARPARPILCRSQGPRLELQAAQPRI